MSLTKEEIENLALGAKVQQEIHNTIRAIIEQDPNVKYNSAFNTAICFKLGKMQNAINMLDAEIQSIKDKIK